MWEQIAVTFSCAAVLSISEIVYTFKETSVTSLLVQFDSWAIIGLNALVALGLLFLAKTAKPSENLYLAAGIGLGYPTLLRSQLAHFAPVGMPSSQFSLSCNRVYGRLQEYFRSGLHEALAATRSAEAIKLQNKYSADQLRDCIEAMWRQMQDKAKKDGLRSLLKKADKSPSDSEKHKLLANALVLEFDRKHYKKILRSLKKEASRSPSAKPDPIQGTL